jgi:hypothetical protein
VTRHWDIEPGDPAPRGIERAARRLRYLRLVLQGTSNRDLLRLVRGLAPKALVIVTADSAEAAQQLYAEGADYVLVPPALTAEHLYLLLRDPSRDALTRARRAQAAELFTP